MSASKTLYVLLACLVSGLAGARADDAVTVVPAPASLELGSGHLDVDAGVRIRWIGHRDARLDAAGERFLARLAMITGAPPAASRRGAILEIRCERDADTPEAYRLEVSASGARLDAETSTGVLRGFETLLQLVRVTEDGFAIPALRIGDEPRFSWRGLLIDVSRHFQPIPVIKRNLDAMAAVKLNVLHWHLTDDQGFRIESKRFPKLHLMGSDGSYYTQDQIREVVEYARVLGIRVVPELDVPGHATSWLVGFPELASAPGPYTIESEYGIRDPALDPTRDDVYRFLDALFGEVTALFPDPYFHIGGDEVTGKHWDENAAIQRFMRERGLPDNHALQGYFNERVSQILSRHGRRMIGWDEILHPDLPAGTVVQSWRGQASLAEAARAGFDGILSFGYYLDHMFPASFHHGVDPLAGATLSEAERARVLGGEACMWGELITPENIDARIWPRAGAVAERLWSTDPDDVLYERLERLSRYLDVMGMEHESGRRRMLVRLAGGHDIEPLETLADVLEPVRFYARTRVRSYRTDTPFNRLVDAVRPESGIARRFAAIDDLDEIRTWLELWHVNHERMKPLLRKNALLAEIVPLSEALSGVAAVGLDAVGFVESGERPSEAWLRDARRILASAPGPDFTVSDHMAAHRSWPEPGTWWSDEKSARKQSEVELMVVPAIEKLVERAMQR